MGGGVIVTSARGSQNEEQPERQPGVPGKDKELASQWANKGRAQGARTGGQPPALRGERRAQELTKLQLLVLVSFVFPALGKAYCCWCSYMIVMSLVIAPPLEPAQTCVMRMPGLHLRFD